MCAGVCVCVVVVEGVQTCTLECLSTSAWLPCAETGTLWERAGSGSLYTQGMKGELRKQTAQKHN